MTAPSPQQYVVVWIRETIVERIVGPFDSEELAEKYAETAERSWRAEVEKLEAPE
jgi:hypothetical protein